MINDFSIFDCPELSEWPRCDATHPCSGGDDDVATTCLFLEQGAQGYCPGSAQTTAITFQDGRCGGWASAELKSLACCLDLGGVDCRAYPFARPSKNGEICERAGDCEPGLECTISEGELPRCLCPGVKNLVGGQALGCSVEPRYPPWGNPPLREPAGCYPTERPEYQRQVYRGRTAEQDRWDSWPGLEPLTARSDPAGKVTLFYRDVSKLHALGAPGLLGKYPFSGPEGTLVDFELPMDTPLHHAAEFAADGDFALLWHDDERGALHRYRAGKWSQTDAPGSSYLGDLAFDKEGLLHLFLKGNANLTYAVENGAWWNLTDVLPGSPAYWSYVDLTISSTRQVNVVLSDCGQIGGALLTLPEQAVVLIGAVCDSVTLSDDSIAAAGIDYREGKIDVVLRSIARDGGVENELVWQMPSNVRVEHPRPRIAVSRAGQIIIAHRTPDGMSVSHKEGAHWVTTRVAPFAGSPVPIFDHNDDLVLFYTLEITAPMQSSEIGDFKEGPPEQLGVIREWNCQNELP